MHDFAPNLSVPVVVPSSIFFSSFFLLPGTGGHLGNTLVRSTQWAQVLSANSWFGGPASCQNPLLPRRQRDAFFPRSFENGGDAGLVPTGCYPEDVVSGHYRAGEVKQKGAAFPAFPTSWRGWVSARSAPPGDGRSLWPSSRLNEC